MADVQDAVAKLNVRTYMVLCRTSPSEGWAEAGQYDGGSDLRAIRSAFEANGQQPVGAEWVAVPVRSWKPRKPQTKTTTSTIWDSVEDIRAAAGEPEEGET